MSAEIINFPEWAISPFVTEPVKIPRQRVFYLGTHSYSGSPGSSWTTEYWVKRVNKGQLWEVYCTTEDSGHERFYMNTFDPEEVQEYFESVQFELSDDDWVEMGWKSSQPVDDAEIYDISLYLPDDSEKYCAICRQRFEDSPFTIHECIE